jgi:hypothetical protein
LRQQIQRCGAQVASGEVRPAAMIAQARPRTERSSRSAPRIREPLTTPHRSITVPPTTQPPPAKRE